MIEYPVPNKPSESVSQAFYLYYQYDTNVPANCPAKGVQRIAQEGIVPLKPYYVYKTEEVASEDIGFFVVTRTLIDGFSTAVKYLDCRNHNFVYEITALTKCSGKRQKPISPIRAGKLLSRFGGPIHPGKTRTGCNGPSLDPPSESS